MGDAYTPNLGLTKPDVGASDDTWGEKLNVNFDILDTSLGILEGNIVPPPNPATATPLMSAGSGLVGSSNKYAREDHVHPSPGGGGGASIIISDTPPTAPANSLWWESDTGILYIRYNDGTSTQWVSVFASSSLPDAPSDGSIYGRRNGAWTQTTNVPPATAMPLVNATPGVVGIATKYAREDHVHPTDTSRYAASNPSGYQTAAQVTASLGAYLPLTGGTLTGGITVVQATGGASYGLNPTQAAQQAFVNFSQSGSTKWQMGKQTDDSFILYDNVIGNYGFSVTGATLSTSKALSVTGSGTFGGNVVVPTIRAGGAVHVWPVCARVRADCNIGFTDSGIANTALFGSINDAGSGWNTVKIPSPLTLDSPLTCASTISASSNIAGSSMTATGGYSYLTNGNTYVLGDGTSTYICSALGATTFVSNSANGAPSALSCGLFTTTGVTANGSVSSTMGYVCRAGVPGPLRSSTFNLDWTGAAFQGWIDSTNFGTFSFTSDYRIKKDVINLPGMWDTVKALRPIKYTQAEFQPPSHKKFLAEQIIAVKKEAEEAAVAPREIDTSPLFKADDVERWGFIAHELQTTLTESAATATKDSPNEIQSPNPWTVIAALTKALQEAMTRIEALEAGG